MTAVVLVCAQCYKVIVNASGYTLSVSIQNGHQVSRKQLLLLVLNALLIIKYLSTDSQVKIEQG